MNGETHILTALVIDEDPKRRAILSRELGSEYPVLCAFSKDDALHVAESAKPDVIVLDVVHAEEDGFATFCELRKKIGTRTIPVVMLINANERLKLEHTARRMKEHSGDGSIAFIEKPVAGDRLCDEVRRMIGGNPPRYCCQPVQQEPKRNRPGREARKEIGPATASGSRSANENHSWVFGELMRKGIRVLIHPYY